MLTIKVSCNEIFTCQNVKNYVCHCSGFSATISENIIQKSINTSVCIKNKYSTRKTCRMPLCCKKSRTLRSHTYTFMMRGEEWNGTAQNKLLDSHS